MNLIMQLQLYFYLTVNEIPLRPIQNYYSPISGWSLAREGLWELSFLQVSEREKEDGRENPNFFQLLTKQTPL